MKSKWRMPHPATMFLLLTMAVVFLSWICDIYGLKVTLPQSGEDIRVQSLLSPEGIRWWLRNAIKNFTGFAPLGMVIIAMFGLTKCIRSSCQQGHTSSECSKEESFLASS